MSEKRVIEKTYKYTIPTPKELFDGFRSEFSGTTLPDSWEASVPWTNTILNIFGEIGRGLGFKPVKEYLRLDQTWEIRHPDVSTIALALEVENTSDVGELLDDELQKLLDVKAFLKVLVFYPHIPVTVVEDEFSFPEVQKKIRSAEIKNPEEMYIVVGITRIDKALEVNGCSLNHDGKAEELGSFQLDYIPKSQQQ